MKSDVPFIDQPKIDQIRLITKALNRKTGYLINDCMEQRWYGVHVVNHKVEAIRCFHSEWMASIWLNIKEWIQRKDCKKHGRFRKRRH